MPFPLLAERVREIRDRVSAAVARGGHAQQVRLVAVTKTYGAEAVEAVWQAGVADVGENRVQEALEKMGAVEVPVSWHLIGHLQRNKAKHATSFSWVHSVDSLRLAEALSSEGERAGRAIRGLVQVNVLGEESKGGFALEDLEEGVGRLKALKGLSVEGVMTMAPLGADARSLREVFSGARAARTLLQTAGLAANELSMGMSSDFEIAVEEGATMVRLGTILFGARA